MSLFNINDELCANNVLNLKEVLMQFTINALLDQPECIYPFAANYFKRKDVLHGEVFTEDMKVEESVKDEESVEEEERRNSDEWEQFLTRTRSRSVYAERFNPEVVEDDDDDIPVYTKTPYERDMIYSIIRKCVLFKAVDDDDLERVIAAMYTKDVMPEEFIIKQGDEGDNFYVIKSGIYEVWKAKDEDSEPELITTYRYYGSFGELALMYNQPRAASVKAVTEGELWVMDRQTFKKLVVTAIYKKRKQFEDLISKVAILEELQPYEKSNLADAMEEKRFSEAEVIIAQGDEADGMYFVIEGTVSVTIENSETQEKREVAVLKEGDYFGELALITQNPRAATVTAIEETTTAFLDKDAFERLLGPCLEILGRNIEFYKELTAKIFEMVKGE